MSKVTLDKVLAACSTFDWVTPLSDLLQDLKGPHCDLHIERYAGWSTGEIKRLLKKNGVQPWGISFTEHIVSLRVRKDQVQEARSCLLQNGVRILSVT